MDSKNLKQDRTADAEQEQSDAAAQSKSNWLSGLLCVNFRDLFPFKAYFFAVFGAFGCLLPYLPLYFKQLGMSATRTGILIGIRPLSVAIGAPLWGIIADKYKKRKVILIAAVCVWTLKHLLIMPVQPKNEICWKVYDNKTNPSPVSQEFGTNALEDAAKKRLVGIDKPLSDSGTRVRKRMGDGRVTKDMSNTPLAQVSQIKSEKADFPWKRSAFQPSHQPTSENNQTVSYELSWVDSKEMTRIFIIILFIVVIGEILGSAVFPLIDACVVDYLGDERAQYGRIRLWGSAGIAVATFAIGVVINNTRGRYVCGQERHDYFIAFYFFAGFMTLGFISCFFLKIVYREPSKECRSNGLKFLFNSVQKSSFWFITLCLGLFDGYQMDFTSWFLDDLGASPFLIGLATALHFCVNVLSLFLSVYVLKAVGHMNAITLGLLFYAVLFVAFSFTTNPWLAVVLYALIGAAFSISWTACVSNAGLISSSLGRCSR